MTSLASRSPRCPSDGSTSLDLDVNDIFDASPSGTPREPARLSTLTSMTFLTSRLKLVPMLEVGAPVRGGTFRRFSQNREQRGNRLAAWRIADDQFFLSPEEQRSPFFQPERKSPSLLLRLPSVVIFLQIHPSILFLQIRVLSTRWDSSSKWDFRLGSFPFSASSYFSTETTSLEK